MTLKKPIVFETTFAIYTATEIIGEGGSGCIYKSSDESGNTWAVKHLASEKATQEKVKRFKNELQFCLKNQHRNIVTVIDHGILKDTQKTSPFYVMPLYKGSLRDLLNSGIPPSKALSYFAQLLDGIEAAHLQKVVHRDLKPENVLYNSGTGILSIADFGIARFEEDELFTAVETKDDTRLANFQYAAPEQRGRGLPVDYHADIYALGLILNEMFTGEVPYGTGYKTISSLASDYEYLDKLVSDMLRQSPGDRPSSIEEVKNQLISHQNEFVTYQRITELKEAVVPVTDIDDPLVIDPPRLARIDWDQGVLTLILHRPVNAGWKWALHNMGSHSSLMGKGPERFSVSEDKVTIDAQEREVQEVINYFKSWLPQVNRVYEERIRRYKQDADEKQRQELHRLLEEQQARQRVLKNTKL